MQFIPAYFPSIRYMQALMESPLAEINTLCHYQKQTYRNRCAIYGANGRLNLTVPIQHSKNHAHQIDGEVKIMWKQDWQKQHWKSLESAYRSSPFFEFYEDELREVFFQRPEYLMEFNMSLIHCLMEWLTLDKELTLAKEYKAFDERELLLIQAKNETFEDLPRYSQVFENKHGFLSNLSTLDLIFNHGPQSISYLEDLR